MEISICYLSNDFSKFHLLDTTNSIVVAPEALLNGTQIQEWVANRRETPIKFATNSLYLLREIYLQKVPCQFINIIDGIEQPPVDCIDDISELEILNRELDQSDRYMNHEWKEWEKDVERQNKKSNHDQD